jgi:HK97 family phage portal protein
MFFTNLFKKKTNTNTEENNLLYKNNEYSMYYNVSPVWTALNYHTLEKIYKSNSTVFRCVHLISECANSMKINTINKNLSLYLNKHIEDIITNLLVYGNCFLHKKQFIIPINNLSILTNVHKVVTGYKSNDFIYNASEVLHLKYCSNIDSLYALSPTQLCIKWVDIGNFIQDYIAGMMQNGGKPSGILSHGPLINEKERSSFREQFRELYKNITHNGSVVMAEGRFDWQSIGIEPEKLHLIDHWNNSIKEIAKCFGVPNILLGITDATFCNYENARKHFWEDLVIPFIINILEKLSFFFHDEVKLNTQNIEIMNEKIWQKNILTINEKRQLLGYQPIEGGDML